jgi:hypothetical protein
MLLIYLHAFISACRYADMLIYLQEHAGMNACRHECPCMHIKELDFRSMEEHSSMQT